MRIVLSLVLALLLSPVIAVTPVKAQDASVYAVSYIEAAPVNRNTVAGMLRQLAIASRKDDGNVRYEILQRVAPTNQFAIVSVWKDQKAYEAHLASAHYKEFRDKAKPLLISAIDDRLNSGMEVTSAAAAGPRGAIYVVTHVDVPPPSKDQCIEALKTLAADSRKEAGNARFEVFQQSNRPNHFSVVEIWKGQGAYDGHITAAHAKAFRDKLTPMTGALYDERLYRAI
jgi:quinol monooxygenase YgiN